MSKADEMFEKLGYKKKNQLDTYGNIWGELFYNIKNMVNISFDYEGRLVSPYIKSNDNYEQSAYITMQELQVINEKVKELGWIDNTTKRDLEYADNPITL